MHSETNSEWGLPIRRDMRAYTSEELIRTQLQRVSVSVSLGKSHL